MTQRGRVVVLGAAGMLGLAVAHHLRRQGWGVVALARQQFDVLASPLQALPLEGARAVVNAAGLINRRVGRAAEADFWRVNALFPRQLADACQRAGTSLVHVSTDCVFAGAGAPHDELAPTDATDLYGASKAAGEPMNACVIRTSIIGPEWQRSDSLLCWLLAQTGDVQGYTHHRWNGVTTLELARVIGLMLEQGADRTHGIRHVHGQNITKHDLLALTAQVLSHPVRVVPAAPGAPRDMRLATRYADGLAQWAIRPLERQLRELAPLCGPRGHWRGDAPPGEHPYVSLPTPSA